MSARVEQQHASPSIIIQALYFVGFGWWASGIWITIAWLLNVTILGIPIGIKMINQIPKVTWLKPRSVELVRTVDEHGDISIEQHTLTQYSLTVRAVYFICIGWWASAIWMAAAWLVSLSILGLPIALWLYSRAGFVMSLYRY